MYLKQPRQKYKSRRIRVCCVAGSSTEIYVDISIWYIAGQYVHMGFDYFIRILGLYYHIYATSVGNREYMHHWNMPNYCIFTLRANICLTSLTRAKLNDKMAFPA